MSINHKRIAGLLLCSLIMLAGCSATNHPMMRMIRLQGDMMHEMADILHGVDDVSDLNLAVKKIEQLSKQTQHRMTQIGKSFGKDDIPASKSETKRLQSAMQREMKKLERIMKTIQKEIKRLQKHDWSKPLLEIVNKSNYKKRPEEVIP